MSDGIFLIRDDGGLVEMNAEPYASEDLLQSLLADHPSVLSGTQLGSGEPRRWLLIRREVGIPSEEGGARQWSLDHLFLDQEGIPTLVEVKRSSDTRIRREVVGQMLDYAANAMAYWPVEQLRAVFEARCDAKGVASDDEIGKSLGPEIDADSLWSAAETNLKAGKLRLVFVADEIPTELRRIIEFLDGQMTQAEVLGVEIRQYVGPGMRTLVPQLVGQTTRTVGGKGPRPQRQWDEHSTLEAIHDGGGPEDRAVAERFFAWAHERRLVFLFGTGATIASFQPGLKDARGYIFPVYLYSSGSFEIEFQTMRSVPYPPFDQEAKRQELLRRINEIPGVNIPDTKIATRPNLALSLFRRPEVLDQFLEVLDWTLDEAQSWRQANDPPGGWHSFSALPPQ